MNLRHIEVFQAILQAGSISGAARLLNVSQPNVSRILGHAEQQLGFELFERMNNRLGVTREAHQLIPEIEALYQRLKNVNSLTEQIRQGKNHLVRLGAAHAFGQQVVVPAIMEYHRLHKLVNVSLVTEHFATLCQQVMERELDLALVFGQQIPAELQAEPLCQAEMVAVLPADMPHPDSVSLAWLAQTNLLMMQPQDPLGRVVHRAMSDRKLQPASSMSIKTYSIIADMVVAGGGTGIVDIFTASRYQGKLQVLPISQPLPFEVMLISRRDTPQSREVQQLKRILKSKCALPVIKKSSPLAASV